MLKKIGNAIMDILFFIVIIFAIIMIMLSVNSDNNGVATLFGYIPFSIQSGSMEPTIMKGDLIVVKQVEDNSNLQKDDIISFFALEEKTKIIKTHRIIEVKKNGPMTSYVTKGDNNPVEDEIEVAPGDIIGKYTDFKINKLGSIYDFLNSKYGFLICIIIPLFILFVYQIYKFIILIIEMKNDGKKERTVVSNNNNINQ